MNRARGFVFATAALGAGVSAVYVTVVRPWALRWGATDQEAARRSPGDGVVQRADFVATRAITIHATADQGWPWLVQIGSGRADWYSYDRLDNAGVPSATEIIPQLQQLTAGDPVPMVAGKDVGGMGQGVATGPADAVVGPEGRVQLGMAAGTSG